MKDYLKNREKAMAWVNGEDHDFAKGIAILKAASFKPGVVGVLERHGSGNHQSDERLMYHMRDFIRCFANESAKEDTDLELSVLDGKEVTEEADSASTASMLSNEVAEKLDKGEYPSEIAAVISRYREAYVTRDKLMKALAELPETNDDMTVEKRRSISEQMKTLSDEMDKLYPQYEAYINEGKVPEDESEQNPEKSSSDISSMSKEELQKLRKGVVTKISRAKNMLLYQKESKQEVENPIKDEKKIAKYNAKIERLTAELHDIDMAIAALA